jgi:pSer/pThr/pTyr-binding forkhead associated (FHA) protein
MKMRIVQGRPRGKYLCFPCGEFVFGRGPECHVRPNSPWVSRQHCMLLISDEGALIRDLGSTNGTLVNGQLVVGERPLVAGDELQVGPLVLQVVAEDLPADATADPGCVGPPAEPLRVDAEESNLDTARMHPLVSRDPSDSDIGGRGKRASPAQGQSKSASPTGS